MSGFEAGDRADHGLDFREAARREEFDLPPIVLVHHQIRRAGIAIAGRDGRQVLRDGRYREKDARRIDRLHIRRGGLLRGADSDQAEQGREDVAQGGSFIRGDGGSRA